MREGRRRGSLREGGEGRGRDRRWEEKTEGKERVLQEREEERCDGERERDEEEISPRASPHNGNFLLREKRRARESEEGERERGE